MFFNSQEWRTWRYTDAEGVRGPKTATKNGVLSLHYQADGSQLVYTAENDNEPQFAYLALLGSNIQTSVKSGENRGKKLEHDFVVLDLQRVPLRKDGETYRAQLPELSSEFKANYAVAAWVTGEDDATPLQAVGGWLGD